MPVSIVADIGRDSGQRINIGTQNPMGSLLRTGSMSFWVKQQLINGFAVPRYSPIIQWTPEYQGLTNRGSFYVAIDGSWTTDYQTLENSVIWDMGDHNDAGAIGHGLINTPDFDDLTNAYHHVITWDISASGGAPDVRWYVNGILRRNTWTDPAGVTAFVTASNFTNPLYIGVVCKALGAITDYSTYQIEGFRNYTRPVTADEVAQMWITRNRDNVRRGLVSKYDFWVDGRNDGPNGVAAIFQHSSGGALPAVLPEKFTLGVHKKRYR